MNIPIPPPLASGTPYKVKTEGLTVPVPTVNIVKETVPPKVNAKRRQNKVNVGSNTKTKVKFGIDQREIMNRGDLDSLRESVGLEPRGYNIGGEVAFEFKPGGPVYPPIYTTDPRKVQAYQDSSALYKAYQFQKKNFGPGYEASLDYMATLYPGGKEALRKVREKNIGKPGVTKLPKSQLTDGYNRPQDDKNYDPLYKVETPIVNYYKSLIGNNPNFRIGMHSSPDLWHRTIKPVAAYYDGAFSPVYAQPSQPYILGKEPTKSTQTKPNPVIQQQKISQPREPLELETLPTKQAPPLTSNFNWEPRSIDLPSTPQSSNEEYNREYSLRIPTIDINKRQVAPRTNRVFGNNVVNPKNQYQRSIEFGSREIPITDDYHLNKALMKMGMAPRGFDEGGQANNTKTITLSTGKVVILK